ncbi:hypothetical protein [Rubrivirga sp. IMCC45206]|uniref:hypothetical protein n=1 Tax=Rubrivirga sp. IMCC45206 TaxID=3391614 RepID=UPI00399019FF
MPTLRLLVLFALAATAAAAQPLAFGSADDPFEAGSGFRPVDGLRLAAAAGPAYLPDDWRAAVRLEADGSAGRFSFGVGQAVHSGDGGLYGPEFDETVDLARVVRYLRWNAVPGSRSYARLGPTERVTLGSGALVRGYRTTTAYDDRRLGAEGAIAGRLGRVAAFAGDVLRTDGVVGAEARLQTGADLGPLADIALVIAGVHDLSRPAATGDSSLTGVEVTLRGTYSGFGPVAVRPFATHARYLGQGSTLGGGLEVGSSNIGDAARASARVGVFASTADFVPGHVGPFYAVSNAEARIVDDGSFFDDARASELAGTPLDSLAAGVDVVLDLRLVAFGRLEISQHFRRHIGDETASAYSLRLAGRLAGGARLEFALDRQDFRGVLDLIQDLGAVNSLVLDLEYPVGRRGVLLLRSRYGYRRLTGADGEAFADGPPRYLVERRFEPLVGVRVGL